MTLSVSTCPARIGRADRTAGRVIKSTDRKRHFQLRRFAFAYLERTRYVAAFFLSESRFWERVSPFADEVQRQSVLVWLAMEIRTAKAERAASNRRLFNFSYTKISEIDDWRKSAKSSVGFHEERSYRRDNRKIEQRDDTTLVRIASLSLLSLAGTFCSPYPKRLCRFTWRIDEPHGPYLLEELPDEKRLGVYRAGPIRPQLLRLITDG